MNRKEFSLFAVILSIFFVGSLAHAEDQDGQRAEGVTKYGVTHNVAPDREIVNIGGRYEPEGIDFYLKKKFDAMEAKMDQLIQKIDDTEKAIKATNERVELLLNKTGQNQTQK